MDVARGVTDGLLGGPEHGAGARLLHERNDPEGRGPRPGRSASEND